MADEGKMVLYSAVLCNIYNILASSAETYTCTQLTLL